MSDVNWLNCISCGKPTSKCNCGRTASVPARDTYTVFAKCENCLDCGKYEFAKGVRVNEEVCTNCGCASLQPFN